MNDPIPPSYSEATSRDWLPLVATYLDDSCLCSALRVSRKWHSVLSPQLWRDPAKHFGQGGEGFHAAFTKFQRLLPRVRPEVRQLTHVFHLIPSRNDFHDEIKSQWLQDILEYLPNLQCLVVSGVPFFDHNALSVLESRLTTQAQYPLIRKSTFPLRLLIADRCVNCTYGKFEYALQQFQHLVLLDLSKTPAARDGKVLSMIGALQNLQILKLRGIRFQDDDFRVLADPFNAGHISSPTLRHTFRLRSLDIRDNLLTDKTVKMIIGRMILCEPPSYGTLRQRQATGQAGIHDAAESFRVVSQTMQNLRGPDLDKQFVDLLSRNDHADAILQQLDDIGLTHLYLAGNAITEEGIIDLVETKRLHVLDAGDWEDASRTRRLRLPDHLVNSQNSAVPTLGTRQIIQSFENSGHLSDLTYLRINHEIVTLSAQEELQENLKNGQEAFKLPQANEGYTGSSSGSQATNLQRGSTTQSVDSLPAYEQLNAYPRLLTSSERSRLSDIEPVQDAKARDQTPLPSYAAENVSLDQNTLESSSHIYTASTTVQPKLQQIRDRHQELRARNYTTRKGLLPGRLPNLETLVLMSIPRLTRSARLITNLKDFITGCAIEHHLAVEQARLEYSTQRIRKVSEDKFINWHARQLFSLQRIILEVIPVGSGEPSEAEVVSPSFRTSKAKTKAAVEDRDVDVFWEASKDDFSFFDEEEDILSNRGDLTTSTFQSTGSYSPPKMSASLKPHVSREAPDADDIDNNLRPLCDVIGEIAAWRAEKKKQYEAGLGRAPVFEVWPGKIDVVLMDPDGSSKDTDYYMSVLR